METPTPPQPQPVYVTQQVNTTTPGQGMAITSLVLGCVSIAFFWLYAIPPILAIIFGGVSMNQAKKAGVKASGMAVAGLVLGVVFTVITAFIFLAVVTA